MFVSAAKSLCGTDTVSLNGTGKATRATHPQNRRNSRDTCNFDREFTKMAVELTPTDKLFIMNLDQDEFLGFSYTNPEYVNPAQG
ncbi:kinase C beta type isoform X2 [Labeo rohita]|uniref:Kinase C beta type isoform X2 n=1 Tax=Labeo rohita TaxID=84645 RepID=A0A498NN71_LABRO|nr:kinase C beta type isoform X2 [Labeo rohita]